MKRYKVLEHTADVRLWVESDTFRGLLAAALEGMAGLIKQSEGAVVNDKRFEEAIELDAPDSTALLVDFLSEVLTLSHQKKAVFTELQIDELDNNRIVGKVTGYRTDGFDDDIKAVTYHEAEIKKNKAGNFETMIVFDI